MRGEV
jgi:hypothetical protein